jgi:hypothetical protein
MALTTRREERRQRRNDRVVESVCKIYRRFWQLENKKIISKIYETTTSDPIDFKEKFLHSFIPFNIFSINFQ